VLRVPGGSFSEQRTEPKRPLFSVISVISAISVISLVPSGWVALSGGN
jgi:hypothetical protein